MRGPDVDRERSEKKLTLAEFLHAYNDGLPTGFPPASAALLKTFVQKYPDTFKDGTKWSLDQHRKRVMDWLPEYLRVNPEANK